MCRICGERVKRQIKDKLTPLKLCATYVKELNIYHGLNTTHDKEDEHPKGMCTHANVPAVLLRVTQKQQVTTRQPTLKKQSVYGSSSTQRYLPLNAPHVATLTRNAKAADQKSSKLVPLKDRRQAADVTVWQTQS